MVIVRPIVAEDYPALHAMAEESGIGFTSLPVNEELLRRKVERSQTAFAKTVQQPGDESYLFVMQDLDSGQVVGTSGIEAALGLTEPNYHYHLSKVVHSSRVLQVRNTVEILTLCNDYTGVSEICTLFLRENARRGLNGRLLSKFRLLFMQEHQQRFSDRVIAEMRGVSCAQGRSPFWQWLQDHFFSMDFPTADYLTGIGQKDFIAELMPKYPIYVNLLSPEAQAVIGKVHEKTQPALRLLQSEGFSCRGYVDIFDAGPTVEAKLEHVRTAQSSRRMPVRIQANRAQTHFFVINTQIQQFRGISTPAWVDEDNGHLVIDAKSAEALGVENGDPVRFAPSKIGG